MESVSQSLSKLLRRPKQSSALPEKLCRQFSLAEIKITTNNFDNDLVILQGEFCRAYKGFIDDCTRTVAIKRLIIKSGHCFEYLLRTEVLLLCQLCHPNLVPLIGYCIDEDENILVCVFIVNGCLFRNLLYKDHDKDPLPWKQRLKICVGVASVLHYLHTGVKHTIIHHDVKLDNILLDEKWEAKLSDFMSSRMCPLNLSTVRFVYTEEDTTYLIHGTMAQHLDAEFLVSGELTDKSDVYSFGVVLLQLLCCRKASHVVDWARKRIQEGTINEMIDPYLIGKIAPECLKIYLDIATSCIRTKGVDRPTMGEVEIELERALQLQESADAASKDGLDPSGEYNYPIVEYTGPASPTPEPEDSIWDSDSTTSADFSFNTTMPNNQ